MPIRSDRAPTGAARRAAGWRAVAALLFALASAPCGAAAANPAAAPAPAAATDPATLAGGPSIAGGDAGASTATPSSTGPVAAGEPAPADAATTAFGAGLERQLHDLALHRMPAGAHGAPRFDVSIGTLDPRLRLAPCERIEPDLPAGARLWGRSRIGLRCLQGPVHWKVYLPITVKAFGVGLVATTAIAAGSVLTAADLAQAEVDWAEDASAAVADPALAVGRMVARPLRAGQSVRESHLKARQWFAAGDTVTVFARGRGFSVAGEAQALNNGIEGQPVRVRTAAGRVLSGQPVGTRRVELPL